MNGLGFDLIASQLELVMVFSLATSHLPAKLLASYRLAPANKYKIKQAQRRAALDSSRHLKSQQIAFE